MRLLTIVLAACPFFALAAFNPTASAADCKPLQILNTIKLENIDDGNRILVPVEINGTPKKLILDTGGYTTQLGRKTAASLGLREEESNSALFDAYGNASTAYTIIDSFKLGQMTGRKLTLNISPLPEDDVGEVAGLLSTNLFARYDIDLDFGAARLNYFSQDHCEGRVTYWPERPLAIVPFTLRGLHVIIPVNIDGHELKAMIDTGAEDTVMSADAAKDVFGLTPGSGDMPQTGVSSSDPLLKFYSHNFEKLGFEGLVVTNPKIDIMTDRMGAGPQVFKSSIRGELNDPYNHVKMDQIIIGMNVLKHLHVYIAYRERKLYISPAGTGESVLFKSTPAPAN